VTFGDAKLLADENIHPDVITFLRQRGQDVVDVFQRGLSGSPDEAVLAAAVAESRVIITHDRDFGRLAILANQSVFGIVYFRPGHIDAQFTIETISTLDLQAIELSPPFILVAERRGPHVRFRRRHL
jgi:predicted nuclease of predicted toxin-antitoxin system